VGARFSALVQTGSTRILYNGYGSFKEVKRGVEHPPTSITEVKERRELYLYPIFGLSWALTD